MNPGARLGKYQLLREIGRGAMGEVWEAINTDTDRKVAIKLLTDQHREIRRRLEREARAIGRLDHPNIVQILDRGIAGTGSPFLVMQLLNGETLEQRLKRERTLPQTRAVEIAVSVARALREAHRKDIIHRDLKPGNIFLHSEPDTSEEIVKVLDFGVSKLRLEDDVGTTQGIVGSPAYMSPEQIRHVEVDSRSDIWALGIVLFEMLAGRRPFVGQTMFSVMSQIVTQPPPRLDAVAKNVDRALAEIVTVCLALEPKKRFRDADALIRALQPFTIEGYHGTPGLLAPRELPTFVLKALALTDNRPEGRSATVGERTEGPTRVALMTSTIRGISETNVSGEPSSTGKDIERTVPSAPVGRSRVVPLSTSWRLGHGLFSVTRLTLISAGLCSIGIISVGVHYRTTWSEVHAESIAALSAFLSLVALVGIRILARRKKEGVADTAVVSTKEGLHETPPALQSSAGTLPLKGEQFSSPSAIDHKLAMNSREEGSDGGLSEERSQSGTVWLNRSHFQSAPPSKSADMRVAGVGQNGTVVLEAVPIFGLPPSVPTATPHSPLAVEVPSMSAPVAISAPKSNISPVGPRPTVSAPSSDGHGTTAAAPSDVPLPSLIGNPVAQLAAYPLPPALPKDPHTQPQVPSLWAEPSKGQRAADRPPPQVPSESAPSLPTSAAKAVTSADRHQERPVISYSDLDVFEALARGRAPNPELASYIENAELYIVRRDGRLLFLKCRQDSSPLAEYQLAAIELEDDRRVSATGTMSTDAFRQSAALLYRIEGSLDKPLHVLAVFRSQPAAGVYRAWHDLGVKQRIRVLAMSPRTLRAAADSGAAGAHLLRTIRRSRLNPFDVRDAIDEDLQFFGAHDMLRDLLHDVTRGAAGFGVFGLDKWGTSSLLRRLRLELSERHVAYIDLLTLQDLSVDSLLRAIRTHLRGARDPEGSTTTPEKSTTSEAPASVEDDLRKTIVDCISADETLPVVLLDHVDELVRSPRGSVRLLSDVVRLLYRLSTHDVGRGRVVVVVAGQDDAILTCRQFFDENMDIVNPLWHKLKPYYTPFFTRDELSDFMGRLGGMVGMSMSSAAIDELFRLTGGHKYLVRRLGSELFVNMEQSAGAEIEIRDVQSASEALLVDGPDYLKTVIERMPEGARPLVSLLAADGRTACADVGAMSFLKKYGLISRDGETCRLTVGLFAMWALRQTSSGQTLMRGPGDQAMTQTAVLQTTFISYGGPDELFARKLYESLRGHGVRAFFFSEHAVPGESLHGLMRKEVNKHDRVILVCSKGSLDRKGVLTEIEETLARETRDGGVSYLVPIRLDKYIFSGWNPANATTAQAVRDRVVADFEGADVDQTKFDAGFRRLLAALKK